MQKLGCLIVFLFSFFILNSGYAQKKKLKQGNIKKLTVVQKKGGNENLLKQSEEVFDANGNTLEELEYNNDGTLDGKLVFKYDAFSNLLEKEVFSRDKKSNAVDLSLKEKRKYLYNGFNELSEEQVYDGKGKLEKKYVYEYNRFKLLTVRTTFDSANHVIQIKKYLYEKF